jgi:hypothetical protein
VAVPVGDMCANHPILFFSQSDDSSADDVSDDGSSASDVTNFYGNVTYVHCSVYPSCKHDKRRVLCR